LIECVDHLLKKEKPFDYIDSHAGAGLYSLHSSEAEKLLEYKSGIGKLDATDWPELSKYFETINAFNPNKILDFYPGSPLFVLNRLRQNDKAWLYELHPQDFTALKTNLGKYRQAHISQKDGLQGLLAVLPPKSRRGLVLIDPAYEVKTDYQQVSDTLIKAFRQFSTGTSILWYPVVERNRIDWMIKQFVKAEIKDLQRFELGVLEDSQGYGMTSAGVFVINPPYQLFEKMKGLLPRLASTLSQDLQPHYQCKIIVEES